MSNDTQSEHPSRDDNRDPSRTLLPPFLRKLADDVEKGTVSDDQLQRVGEFYASFLFHEEVENNTRAGSEGTGEEDFTKFIFMGYYVYSQISKGKNL